MKKEFFYVELKNKDGEEYVWIPESELIVEPYVLTRYLREGIRNQDISGGLGVTDDQYTKYMFDAKNIDSSKPNHYFVVKISNQLIKEGSPTANIIKSLSKRSVKQTKKNITRFVAGLTAGFILITSSVFIIAKEIKNLKNKVNENERNTSIGQEYIENHKLPEKAHKQYYVDLEQRAKSGDENAIKEYSYYLAEQLLKEQAEEEKSNIR